LPHLQPVREATVGLLRSTSTQDGGCGREATATVAGRGLLREGLLDRDERDLEQRVRRTVEVELALHEFLFLERAISRDKEPDTDTRSPTQEDEDTRNDYKD